MIKSPQVLLYNLYFIFILLIAFTLPFSIQINTIIILVVAALWVYQKQYLLTWQIIKKNKISVISIIFFLYHIIGIFYTKNITYGLKDVEVKLSLMTFTIIFSIVSLNTKFVTYILLCFITACFCLGVFFHSMVIYKIIALNQPFSYFFTFYTWTNFSSTSLFAINPSFFAMYIVFATFSLLIIIDKNWQQISPIFKTVALAWIVYFSLLIVLLGAKMATINFFVLLNIFFLTSYLKHKKVILLVILLLFNILTFLSIVNISDNKDRFQKLISEKDFIRQRNWHTSFEVIKEKFFWGVGTGDILDELQKKRVPNWQEYLSKYDPHNQYLQTWLQLGIPGLCLLLSYFGISLYTAIKNKNILHVAFLYLFIISCLTESMLQSQKGVVYFNFFNFVFLYSYSKDERKSIYWRNPN